MSPGRLRISKKPGFDDVPITVAQSLNDDSTTLGTKLHASKLAQSLAIEVPQSPIFDSMGYSQTIRTYKAASKKIKKSSLPRKEADDIRKEISLKLNEMQREQDMKDCLAEH